MKGECLDEEDGMPMDVGQILSVLSEELGQKEPQEVSLDVDKEHREAREDCVFGGNVDAADTQACVYLDRGREEED